jgi:hypothetical protein
MADEYQIQYEYSDGNTIDFKTNDLKISYHRAFARIATRKDGTRVVIDPNDTQYRVFTFSAIISGNTMDTLDGVQMGSITYSGAYPRIQKIYWDGDSTESNIEVMLTQLEATQVSHNAWRVQITLEEKDQ